MDQQQFISFCQELIKLKEKLKCPICLDIIEETTELECGHKFCFTCYCSYKTNSNNQQNTCPLCKSVIKRRSPLYKDEFANRIANFVSEACRRVEKRKLCHIEEIVIKSVAESKQVKNKPLVAEESKTRQLLDNEPSTSKKDAFDKLMKVPKDVKGLIHTEAKPNTRKEMSVKLKKSTNETFSTKSTPILDLSTSEHDDFDKLIKKTQKKVVNNESGTSQNEFKTKTSTNKNSKVRKTPVASELSTTKDSAFEKLKNMSQELCVNKKGTLHKYIRKKKDPEQHVDYEIYNFVDDTNKSDVVQWLNDNRNKFDRLTQTQYLVNEKHEEMIPKFNIPSVSQQRKGVTSLPTKLKKKARARSLDLEIKPKREKARRSDGSVVGLDDYTIEEINTEDYVIKKAEKNVLMQIIEDEYLNKMENELQKKPGSGQKEHPSTQNSTTGWQRIEKITKTLRKNEKLPKKLNITLQHSQNTSVTKGSRKLLKVLVKNEKLKENTGPSKVLTEVNAISNDNNTDIHKNNKNRTDVEIDINVNRNSEMEKVVEDPLKGAIDVNVNKTNEIEEACEESIDADMDVNVNNTSHLKESLMDAEIDVIIKKYREIEKISVASKDSNVHNNQESKVTNLYDLNAFEHYVKQNMKPIPKLHNDSSFSQSSDKENNENLTNIVEKPQKIIVLDSVLVNTSDEIDPYTVPTQKLNNSNHTARNNVSDLNESFHEIQDFDEVMATLLDNLKKIPEDFDGNKRLTKRHMESIRKYLEKLNDGHKVLPVKSVNVDRGVQTECAATEVQTQTDAAIYCSTGAQTDTTVYCTADSQTTPRDSCENCHKISLEIVPGGMSPPKPTARRNSSGNGAKTAAKFQGDEFPATLDLLNFETQEMEKQFLQKKVTEKPLPEKEMLLSNQEKIDTDAPIKNAQIVLSDQEYNFETNDFLTNGNQKSAPNTQDNEKAPEKEDQNILVCTLTSDAGQDKTHVSLKRTLSDSSDSSDVVAVPKRRCNRFIRDDLSVEFGKTQKKSSFTTGLSTDSDDDNHEEYLNKIMKKYENGTDDCHSSPASNKENINIESEEDLDKIVARVNENVEKLSKLNENTKSSSYHTASQHSLDGLNDDNVFLNNHNLSKLDSDVRRYKQTKGPTQSSDIIPETESMEPLPKRVKRKKINEAFDEELSLTVVKSQEGTKPVSPVKSTKDTFCPELEDSLDGLDFGNIEMEESNKNLTTKDNKEAVKSNEEDLFSDEDYIVETTPQKERSLHEKRSQPNIVTNLSSRFPVLDDVDKEIIENFELNFAPLSPPPGFEDEKDETAPEEVTVIDVDTFEEELQKSVSPAKLSQEKDVRAATPDVSSEEMKDVIPVTPGGFSALKVAVRKVCHHSTPINENTFPRETLGLSPIVEEKSIFEKAYSSNTLTSNITQDTPRKPNILTSHPKQKSILNYVKPSPGSIIGTPNQKPCIACTRLGKDQIQSISLLTNKKLATYSAKFNDTVTHMVVTVDENRKIKDYTMKFVCAVASGIWVLGFEWIQECLKSNAIVPEEPFEVFDDSGNSGPKTARLTRHLNPLFRDYKFFCVSPLYSTTVEDVEDVITRLGGTTVRNIENLKKKDGKIGLIITEGRSTQDFEIYEKWLDKYKFVTVDIEWLSRSVGRYKILSVRPYIWCSDDLLDDLGYPSHLVENTSCSSEQF